MLDSALLYINIGLFANLIEMIWLKGSLDAKLTFTCSLNWSVCWQCVYTTPYNDKIHPVCFLYHQNHKPFLRSSHSQIIGRVTSHRPRLLPRLLINTGVFRPEWTVISPPLFRLWSRYRQERPSKWLRCFVVRSNNEHSSPHLLSTSELLKMQWLTFVCEGNASPICLHASMFAWITRDPASPTEEVSIQFYMNLCKSPFLIMC